VKDWVGDRKVRLSVVIYNWKKSGNGSGALKKKKKTNEDGSEDGGEDEEDEDEETSEEGDLDELVEVDELPGTFVTRRELMAAGRGEEEKHEREGYSYGRGHKKSDFLGTNKPPILYFWKMVEDHGILKQTVTEIPDDVACREVINLVGDEDSPINRKRHKKMQASNEKAPMKDALQMQTKAVGLLDKLETNLSSLFQNPYQLAPPPPVASFAETTDDTGRTAVVEKAFCQAETHLLELAKEAAGAKTDADLESIYSVSLKRAKKRVREVELRLEVQLAEQSYNSTVERAARVAGDSLRAKYNELVERAASRLLKAEQEYQDYQDFGDFDKEN